MLEAIKQLNKFYVLFLKFPQAYSAAYVMALFYARVMLTLEILVHHPEMPFEVAEDRATDWLTKVMHRYHLRTSMEDQS